MSLNAFTLALKAMHHRRLGTLLNLVLMALGVGLMAFVMSAAYQLEKNALRNAEGIDLVVGAKGSPLQLILSAVYHVDTPTGNIPLTAQAQLSGNRLVKKVVPLALGDSYQGFRIVGTNADYPALYRARLAEGHWFETPMQAVLGKEVAARSGLKIGDRFSGSHGMASAGDPHGATPFTVVGILEPGAGVVDRLVLTPVESVWKVHESHGEHEEHAEHAQPAAHQPADEERELTALLVQYASPLAAVSLPRLVNGQSQLQAAQPALEAAKLFRMLGVGVDVLRAIAVMVMLSAALSMFVALYHALEERRSDMAILRILGASPSKLFLLLLSEGIVLSLAGSVLGLLLGHAALAVAGHALSADQNLAVSAWTLAPGEAWLGVMALAIGVLAALLPALRAYRTDIANTLAQ